MESFVRTTTRSAPVLAYALGVLLHSVLAKEDPNYLRMASALAELSQASSRKVFYTLFELVGSGGSGAVSPQLTTVGEVGNWPELQVLNRRVGP